MEWRPRLGKPVFFLYKPPSLRPGGSLSFLFHQEGWWPKLELESRPSCDNIGLWFLVVSLGFLQSGHNKRMFWYSKHVEGCLMKEYKYDPTDSGRWALSIGLVCSTSLFRHACIGSPYIALLSSTCGNAAIERNLPKNCIWGSCGSLAPLQPCFRVVGEPGSFFRTGQ